MIGNHDARIITMIDAGIVTTIVTESVIGIEKETEIGTAIAIESGTEIDPEIANEGTGIEKRENIVRRPEKMDVTPDTKVTPLDIEVHGNSDCD